MRTAPVDRQHMCGSATEASAVASICCLLVASGVLLKDWLCSTTTLQLIMLCCPVFHVLRTFFFTDVDAVKASPLKLERLALHYITVLQLAVYDTP